MTLIDTIINRMLTADVPKRNPLAFLCCCCFPQPRAVVTVHLDSAKSLEKQDIIGAGEGTRNMLLY